MTQFPGTYIGPQRQILSSFALRVLILSLALCIARPQGYTILEDNIAIKSLINDDLSNKSYDR